MGKLFLRFSKLLLFVFVFNLASPLAGAAGAVEGDEGDYEASLRNHPKCRAVVKNGVGFTECSEPALDFSNKSLSSTVDQGSQVNSPTNIEECSRDPDCQKRMQDANTQNQPSMGKCGDDNFNGPCETDSKKLNLTSGTGTCPDLSSKQLACQNAVSEANDTCDSDKNGELNSANSAASQISQQLGGITSSNIALACSNFANVSKLATGAFASYQAYCLSEKVTAQNVCNELDAELKELATTPSLICNYNDVRDALAIAKQQLSRMQTRVNEAQNAVKQLGQTTLNAQQCECMTAASQTDPKCTGKFDPCTTDPNSQLCLMSKMSECNMPSNASSPLCICNKNPNDPICPGSMKPNVTGQGVANGSSGGGSSSGGSSGSQTMFDDRLKGNLTSGLDLNVPRPGFIPGEGGPQNAEKLAVSGGGNNSLLSGAGVNASGGRKGGGKSGEKDPINVNAGFRSGGGSGFGGPGGGPRGGAGGGYVSGSGKLSDQKVDLRQFLPNGKYDPRIRGIAGLRQSPDGITGPHSDIWMKIKARYLFQIPSLNP